MSEKLSMKNRFPSPSRPVNEVAPKLAPGYVTTANFPVGFPFRVLYPAAARIPEPPSPPAMLARIHGLFTPYVTRNSLNAVLVSVVVQLPRMFHSGPPKVSRVSSVESGDAEPGEVPPTFW